MIKWIVVILILGSCWYLANFFWSMDTHIRHQVKKDAVEAIESGDANVLVEPLTIQVKEDLLHKKASFFESVKQKLKDAVDRLID